MDTQKQVFQQTIENQSEHWEKWSRFLDELWFQVEVNFFQSEKR